MLVVLFHGRFLLPNHPLKGRETLETSIDNVPSFLLKLDYGKRVGHDDNGPPLFFPL